MGNLKFSIVTAAFNSVLTIRRCLDASLNQQYIDFEHIVVDGLSKDGTVDILAEYSAQDSRIKYTSELDKGIYDAINKGIKMSEGNYILIIGSDDWLESEALSRANSFLESNSEVCALAGGIIKHYNGKSFVVIKNAKDCARRYHIPVNHIGTFIKRDIYERIGLYSLDYKIAGDYEFFLRAVNKGLQIRPFSEIITNFSCNGFSSAVESLPILNRELFNIRSIYLSKSIAFLLYVFEQLIVTLRIWKRK